MLSAPPVVRRGQVEAYSRKVAALMRIRLGVWSVEEVERVRRMAAMTRSELRLERRRRAVLGGEKCGKEEVGRRSEDESGRCDAEGDGKEQVFS